MDQGTEEESASMRLSRQKWGWALLGLFCLSIAANLAVTPSSVQGASASAASAQLSEDSKLDAVNRRILGSAQTRSGPPFKVTIKSSERFQETHNTMPVFAVDFGQKVQQFDPTVLFNITGTNRTNVAYTLNNGQVFVKAYIQPWTEAHIIRVSVNPGITFTPNGTANAAAMYTLQYSPQRHSMQWLAYGVGIAISYLITGAIAATIIACHLGVLVPAGVGGLSALGLIFWAQKLYLLSKIPVFGMPRDFIDFGDSFAWSMANIVSPWDAFLKQPVAFATPQQSFQPSLLQQSQQGAFLSAQTLPLNNSQTVEQVLAVVEHPRFVSTVVIKPDLIPRSPPPPPELSPPPPPPPPSPPPPDSPPPPPPSPPPLPSPPPPIWSPPPPVSSPPPPPVLPPPPPSPPPISSPPPPVVSPPPLTPVPSPPPISVVNAAWFGSYSPPPVRNSLPPTPLPPAAPLNLQGLPGTSLYNLQTSLGVPMDGKRRKLSEAEKAEAISMMYVVSSTGLNDTNTGSKNQTDGLPALDAVLQLQNEASWSRFLIGLHLSRVTFWGSCFLLLIAGLRLWQFTLPTRTSWIPRQLSLFPRLELLCSLVFIPAFAMAASSLMGGSAGYVLSGVALYICVVVVSIVSVLVWIVLYVAHPTCNRYALIVRPDQPVLWGWRAAAEDWILRPLCGRAYPACDWLDVHAPLQNGIHGTGVLYENSMSRLCQLSNATFLPTPGRHRFYRGRIVPFHASLSRRFSLESLTSQENLLTYWIVSLRSISTILPIAKLSVIAICGVGIVSATEISQVSIVLAVCALHLLYLRLVVPYRMRLDQVCEIVGSLADIATVISMLLLTSQSPSSMPTPGSMELRWKLGIVMIVSQLFSFAVYALTALYRIWATLANANWEAGFLWRPTSPGQKLANAASLILLKRRRRPSRLAAKYAQLWMTKALPKRSPSSTPISARIKPYYKPSEPMWGSQWATKQAPLIGTDVSDRNPRYPLSGFGSGHRLPGSSSAQTSPSGSLFSQAQSRRLSYFGEDEGAQMEDLDIETGKRTPISGSSMSSNDTLSPKPARIGSFQALTGFRPSLRPLGEKQKSSPGRFETFDLTAYPIPEDQVLNGSLMPVFPTSGLTTRPSLPVYLQASTRPPGLSRSNSGSLSFCRRSEGTSRNATPMDLSHLQDPQLWLP